MQSATLRDVRTGLDEVQAGRAPARARRGEGSLLRDGPYANGCVEPVSCEFEPSLRRQARILEIGYQRPANKISPLSLKIRKFAPQRLRYVPPSRGNVATISSAPDIPHRDRTGWPGRQDFELTNDAFRGVGGLAGNDSNRIPNRRPQGLQFADWDS